MRMTVFLALSVVLSVVLVGCSSNPDDQIRKHFADAERSLKQHRLSQAESAVDKAIRVDPACTDTYWSAIRLYAANKLWGRAEEVAKQLVARAESGSLDEDPDTETMASFYVALAEAQQRGRDLQAAEINYKKAVALAPNSAELLNTLGYFYAEEGIKLKEALKVLTRASKLSPDAPHIMDSLGWAQHKLGRHQDAVQTLRRVVVLVPDEAEPRYHLGAAYLKLGRKAEARVELEKALTLDPKFSEAAKLLRNLQK